MLRFIRERVRGRHKKLLHDYIVIFFIMGTVLFLSFFVIGYIADSTAMGQSRGLRGLYISRPGSRWSSLRKILLICR